MLVTCGCTIHAELQLALQNKPAIYGYIVFSAVVLLYGIFIACCAVASGIAIFIRKRQQKELTASVTQARGRSPTAVVACLAVYFVLSTMVPHILKFCITLSYCESAPDSLFSSFPDFPFYLNGASLDIIIYVVFNKRFRCKFLRLFAPLRPGCVRKSQADLQTSMTSMLKTDHYVVVNSAVLQDSETSDASNAEHLV